MCLQSGAIDPGLGLTCANLRLIAAVAVGCFAVGRGAWHQARRLLRQNLVFLKSYQALCQALVDLSYEPATAAQYAACVARFLAQVGTNDVTLLRDGDVIAFLHALAAGRRSNATVRLHLCALRAVFDGFLGMRLTAGIVHVPRPPRRPVATAAQVRTLMEACATPQERLVVEKLNHDKVMPGKLVMEVVPAPSASGQPCAEPPSPEAPATLPAREPLPTSKQVDWLLPSPRRPGPLSTRTLRRIVQRLAARCGLHLTCTAIRLAPVVPLAGAA
jgi:hypothetical protein